MPLPDMSVPEPECWDLLARASIGRIAITVDDMPMLLPVQYYVDGHQLALCLGQHNVITRTLAGTVVAFAVDAIEASSSSGWMVQVQGVARIPRATDAWRDCGQPDAGQGLRIEPTRITGHHFTLCSYLSSLDCLLAMGK